MAAKTSRPEFAPGFDPTPDADLDDPTLVQEAVANVAPAVVASSGQDLTALVTALAGLVQQLSGQIGADKTATILGEMGSKVLSVEKIDVPAFVLANVKGFDQAPHYRVVDEIRYPQMNDRAPLVRTRGLPAEKLTELGIPIPGAGAE